MPDLSLECNSGYRGNAAVQCVQQGLLMGDQRNLDLLIKLTEKQLLQSVV